MRQGLLIIAALLAVGAGIVLVSRQSSQQDFNLPKGGETSRETIMVQDQEKEIFVTDGVKHSIPLEELTTLLPPDQIPPLDNPAFVSISQAAQWLKDTEPGIAFSKGDTHRFYPYLVLTWHEIVNDTVEGQRILVSYCPLCLTGFVLDPLVQGERVEFGTSGKLWNSNLVMYDRKTNSLWPQVLAEAVVGEATGTKLKTLSSDQVRYGDWKEKFPQGQVLSRDTGFSRRYGSYPYAGGNYFGVDQLSLNLVRNRDDRLPLDAFVFGVVVNNRAKAYPVEEIKKLGEVEDVFEGTTFVLRRDPQLDVMRIYEKQQDGTEQRINPMSGFWFSWSATYPETEVYNK